MNMQPFNAAAKSIGVTVTSSASSSAALPGQGAVLRAVNAGANICYIAVGSGTQTAVAADGTARANATPILPGTDVVLSIPTDAVQNFSAISASGTTLILQVGEGM